MLSVLTVVHLVGLALAMGSATAKLYLMNLCRKDSSFVATFVAVSRPITRLIIVGLLLLTLSGIGLLLPGYPFAPRLLLKLVLVAALWVLGPVIDKVAEPRFVARAPAPGTPVSAGFLRAQRLYLALELTATLLFYVIVAVWVLG
jgi:hypothetical protein